MRILFATILLLLAPFALAEEPAPAAESAAGGYSECASIAMWVVSGRVANNSGVPDNNVVRVPDGWELVNVIASAKSPLMIVCR